MKHDRHYCYPADEVWEKVFSFVPNPDEREKWWNDALVGDQEWADYLRKISGRKKFSIKRVQKILDQHTKNGKFVGGNILSEMCMTILSYDYLEDGRRSRAVPICFNKDRLKSEWEVYDRETKSKIRQGVAMVRHHGTKLKLPDLPLEKDILRRMGYAVDTMKIEVRAIEYPPIFSDCEQGYRLGVAHYNQLGDAVETAIHVMVRSVYEIDKPPVASASIGNIVREFARENPVGLFYVTFADKSLAIRRVIKR